MIGLFFIIALCAFASGQILWGLAALLAIMVLYAPTSRASMQIHPLAGGRVYEPVKPQVDTLRDFAAMKYRVALAGARPSPQYRVVIGVFVSGESTSEYIFRADRRVSALACVRSLREKGVGAYAMWCHCPAALREYYYGDDMRPEGIDPNRHYGRLDNPYNPDEKA